MKTSKLLTLMISLVLLMSACRANVSHNNDGSLTVETTINQQELQDAINTSLADPLVTELTASLQPGYILVTGERQRLNDATKTDSLSFRLDLGVSNGQLTATVSNAMLDGKPIEQNRVDHWNATIANRLANLASKHPRSRLQAVNVTPDGVTMTGLVTK